MKLDEHTYLILVLRYKELQIPGEDGNPEDGIPFDLTGHITEIDTGMIDSNYMNSKFTKYLKALGSGDAEKALDELHKTFASLSQEEQKYAELILHDIERGEFEYDDSKNLRDYINDYQAKVQHDRVRKLSDAIGVAEALLRNLMSLRVTEKNINEFGRYDELKATVDKQKAKEYLEHVEGKEIKPFQVNIKVDKLIRRFIFEDGFEI